jgi:hypothetical protein
MLWYVARAGRYRRTVICGVFPIFDISSTIFDDLGCDAVDYVSVCVDRGIQIAKCGSSQQTSGGVLSPIILALGIE